MNKTANTFLLLTAIVLGPGAVVHGASILNSKHNLSASTLLGQGTIKATTESEVCIFCHTPHNARQNIPYLWNRENPTEPYTPYTSTTLTATAKAVEYPTGASRLCLSCHDGTIALGKVLSRSDDDIPFIDNINQLSNQHPSYLGTDLSDDHPVSFNYSSSVSESSELKGTLPAAIKLDNNGDLQCTACHDPHDNALGKFLVATNEKSELCLGCHDKTGWLDSHHAKSLKQWTTGTDPWPDSEYTTVADNGCGNCHRPHRAGRPQQLLKQFEEEKNCLACHSGQVATNSNIANEVGSLDPLILGKQYRHPVGDYSSVHDAAEDFTAPEGVDKHVECADCHNPHQVNNTTAIAPLVSGKNIGVQGIDSDGLKTSNAENLYEICFKCHADTLNNVITTPEITRQVPQLDTRVEFYESVSSHPVIRLNSGTLPSLESPYTTAGGNIYCTDCHGSDDPDAGAKGPHGSQYKHLLVANYSTAFPRIESIESAYELCFTCHNQDILMSGSSDFPLHNRHVSTEQVPCSACHDSHGSSSYTSLINFDTNLAGPNSGGDFYFNSESTSLRGECALMCHSVDGTEVQHTPRGYDKP